MLQQSKFLLGLVLYEDNPHLHSFIADHDHEMSSVEHNTCAGSGWPL